MSNDETIKTSKGCHSRTCRFNWKGVCTNETFDSENPIPCCDTDN